MKCLPLQATEITLEILKAVESQRLQNQVVKCLVQITWQSYLVQIVFLLMHIEPV